MNINYFINNEVYIIYIENYIARQIITDLEPYFRKEGPYYIRTFNELIIYLKNEYYNFNYKKKVIYEFNDLKFEINANFQEFYNKFVRLANKYYRPTFIQKQEFNWKFPT